MLHCDLFLPEFQSVTTGSTAVLSMTAHVMYLSYDGSSVQSVITTRAKVSAGTRK